MARKRSNGMGSVFKNERRGRWEAHLVVGYDDLGRPKRRIFTAKTRAGVEARLQAAHAALEQGLAIPDERTTIATFAQWWLDAVLPGEGLAPNTERSYRDVLNAYVLPALGQRTLTGKKAITPADVETMTGNLMRDGYSHRTADISRTVIGKMLRSAEQRGLVARNVARLAKPPRDRGVARKIKAFTVDEVHELLAALEGTRWHPVVVVGVTTGLRPQELLALHWPDVHLDGKAPYLSVRHAITHTGGAALKAPKRERSYRTVPLTPEAVGALKSWRRTQAEERLRAGELWSDDWAGLVFTTEDGRPHRVDNYRHVLGRARPGASPHRLRHTYATHLLEAGTPIHHVAELLGDAVATVEHTYSHVLRTKHEIVAVARGLVSS
jgi:integrase